MVSRELFLSPRKWLFPLTAPGGIGQGLLACSYSLATMDNPVETYSQELVTAINPDASPFPKTIQVTKDTVTLATP